MAPFVAFLRALAHVRPLPQSMLDVGCGCGHYGALTVSRFNIHYHGTDLSPAMIDQAKWICPNGSYRVCAFADNYFEAFPLVLVGQVMEYTPDPWLALDLVLSKLHGHVILHRLRRTGAESHFTEPEATYCGYRARNYLWNAAQLKQYIARRAGIVHAQNWENYLTMVVKR